MARQKRATLPETPRHTAILLKEFPLALHREMKATAIRRGLRVSEAYARACELFLDSSQGAEGGERP